MKGSIRSLCLSMAGVMFLLPSCDGILSGIYDEPSANKLKAHAGQLHIDASDWTEWNYIDFKELTDSVAANQAFDPSSA